MPQFWEKTPDFDLSLCAKGNVWFQTVFVTDRGIDRSVNVEPLNSGFMRSLTPATRSPRLGTIKLKESVKSRRRRNNKSSHERCYLAFFLTFLFCGLELHTTYLEVLLTKVPLKYTRVSDCISKRWEIYCVIFCNMSLIITASGKRN